MHCLRCGDTRRRAERAGPARVVLRHWPVLRAGRFGQSRGTAAGGPEHTVVDTNDAHPFDQALSRNAPALGTSARVTCDRITGSGRRWQTVFFLELR
jgi:hypothetical protein